MDRATYREGWDWKKNWYSLNGFTEGRNFFTSTEEQIRDVGFIDELARKIQRTLA
jgi:hypothetical protein